MIPRISPRFGPILARKLQHIRNMHVYSIPMRWGYGNNYCYVVVDDSTKQATIIDPAAPNEVLPYVEKLESSGELKLTSITNTPADGATHKIGESLEVTALHTPCHTQDSICWYVKDLMTGDQAVFTGDTLFNCGCGRFFEGDANQMQAALSKLINLPDTTKLYPGHEYTKSNVKFALSVDPDNQALRKLEEYCNKNEKTTGVFTMADEKEYNPFLRTDDKQLQAKLGTKSAVSTMAQLRSLKDRF